MRPSGSEPTDAEPESETGPLLRSYGASEAYASSTTAREEGAGKEGQDGSRYSRLWRGFCAYSVAGEVFAIVSAGLFLPVVLETYARQNGVLASGDRSTPCPPSGAADSGDGGEDGLRCVVRFAGTWVDTASFSLMVYSLSVAVQALTVISMGGLADDRHARHRLLVSFALCGSSLCIVFLALSSSSAWWPLSALFALGANVTYGASNVCLNAYLPELGRTAPATIRAQADVVRAHNERNTTHRQTCTPSEDDDSAADPDAVDRAKDVLAQARAGATRDASSRAIAWGYAAGIGALIGLLPLMSWLSARHRAPASEGDFNDNDETGPLRFAIAMSGAWWLVGTCFAGLWLRPTEEPSVASRATRSMSYRASIARGWRGLGLMLGEWRRLPQTFIFLAAWFLLSDCFATITSTAVLFAKTSLNLPTSSLIVISILSPLSGLTGALAVPRLQHSAALARFGLTTHRTLLLIVVAATIIPLWGLLALRSALQMYLLACVFGFLYGSFQAYARSCFSDLIPPSRSAQFFGLYSITDKSSSFLGPLLVAVVTNQTGEIRYAFWVILALLLASVPILARVDVRAGSEDAERYDREAADLPPEEEVLAYDDGV
ncbi:Autophagy protein 22 [Rhodotorula sphaerocarpa]